METAWALRTYYLVANLEAIANVHPSVSDQVGDLEAEIAQASAVGDDLPDEQRQMTRQQSVLAFLERRFDEMMAVIRADKETWRPIVSWEKCSQELGIPVADRRRRHILELLKLDPDVQQAVSAAGMSLNAAQGLSALPPEAQRAIVAEHGELGQKSRGEIETLGRQLSGQPAAPSSGRPSASSSDFDEDDDEVAFKDKGRFEAAHSASPSPRRSPLFTGAMVATPGYDEMLADLVSVLDRLAEAAPSLVPDEKEQIW